MTPTFYHMVFFWLKEPGNQQHRDQFEKSLKKFIHSTEYALGSHIGVPAMTPRDVVDNSYTYNLVVTFKSKEDQDAYQAEQVHHDFIKECKDLWERVQVYDSVAI